MTGAVTATLPPRELTPELVDRVSDMLRRPVRVRRVVEVLRLPAHQVRHVGQGIGLTWNPKSQYMEIPDDAPALRPPDVANVPGALPIAAPTGRREWRAEAVCRQEDLTHLFDRAGIEHATRDQPAATRKELRQAQAACARCPVRGDCLNFALARIEYGYWAGTTRTQRAAMARNAAARARRAAQRLTTTDAAA